MGVLSAVGLHKRYLAHPPASRIVRALYRAGVVPASVLRGIPLADTFHARTAGAVSFQYAVTPEDDLGRRLFWNGLESWERETMPIFEAHARSAPPSSIVLDVGAHTGLFSLYACAVNPAIRVIAFEPVPALRARVVANVTLNRFDDRCEVRAEAVSDVQGIAPFVVPEDDLLIGSLASGGTVAAGAVVQVPVTTVDAVVPPGTTVHLAKIDVEGFEDRVLAGMERVLTESKPFLIFECLPDGPSHGIETILHRHDYEIFHLSEHGPVAVQTLAGNSSLELRNYLGRARARVGQPDGARAAS